MKSVRSDTRSVTLPGTQVSALGGGLFEFTVADLGFFVEALRAEGFRPGDKVHLSPTSLTASRVLILG